MRQDPYRSLQVHHGAGPEVVMAAYEALARKHGRDDNRLRELNIAKDILLDEKARRKYDEGTDQTGKVIGSYRVISKIAEGGFGATYKGEHLALGTPVCIKHAHKISATDEALLMEEAAAIWDMRHHGIPAIRDIMKLEDQSLILVMSYIPGPTLEQHVENRSKKMKIKEIAEEVAWITERLLNILKYLHFHGRVHGDVKPQNVILDPSRHMAVLVDYGLTAIRPTATSSNKGYTPYFASPEQINGGAPIPESDLYSLGMTMVYALGGDIETKHVHPDVPDPMCDFLKSLIRYQPLNRPNWTVDLQEQFQEVRQNSFGRKHFMAK